MARFLDDAIVRDGASDEGVGGIRHGFAMLG
jgi:hypothetical protein